MLIGIAEGISQAHIRQNSFPDGSSTGLPFLIHFTDFQFTVRLEIWDGLVFVIPPARFDVEKFDW